MQCWKCGATVRSGAKLCVYCGANLATDAAEADASMNRRPSSGGRSERDVTGGRARRDDDWNDSSEEDDGRRPYASGRGSRDGDRGGSSYRGRGGDEGDDAPREPYRRTPRDGRDPLADPRAPRSVRSMPTRDANASRRGSSDRFDRWNDGDGAQGRDDRYDDAYRERRENRPRADRYGEEDRWEPRGPSPRDRYDERGRAGRDPAFQDDSQEYSAEYPSSGWRDESAEYGRQGRYPREDDYTDPRGRGWQDAGRGRSARGAYDDAPMDDSWSMPATTGWTEESAVVPAPPTRRGAQRGKSGSAERQAKKQRRGPMIVGIAVLVVALVGAGVYFYPTIKRHLSGASGSACAPSTVAGTPVAASTPPANYKLYTDKQAGYSVPYPSSWSTSSGTDTSQAQADDVTRFTQSSPNAVFTVEHTPTFDCNTNTEIIDSEVLGGQQAGEAFSELVSAGGTQTVNGEQCLRKEYSVTTSSKASLHMAIIACHHAGKGYAFVIYSDASAYSQVNTSTFQTMLSNFRFSN